MSRSRQWKHSSKIQCKSRCRLWDVVFLFTGISCGIETCMVMENQAIPIRYRRSCIHHHPSPSVASITTVNPRLPRYYCCPHYRAGLYCGSLKSADVFNVCLDWQSRRVRWQENCSTWSRTGKIPRSDEENEGRPFKGIFINDNYSGLPIWVIKKLKIDRARLAIRLQ